jgi:hypothetical protein
VRGEGFPFHGAGSRIGIGYLHTSGNRSVWRLAGKVLSCGRSLCMGRCSLILDSQFHLYTASCFMLISEGQNTTAWAMTGEIERKVILVWNEAPIHEDV